MGLLFETQVLSLKPAWQYAVDRTHTCQRLLRNYPTLFDGHDRMGLLRSAQGRFAHAAEHFEIVLSMMKKDPFGVDHETVKEFTRLRDEALARVED